MSTIIYFWCRGKIYKNVGRLWRVSDCEELVGVTWRVSDCEENVGQFSSPLLILQFSTTISVAKLADKSFSTFSCIDSPIPKPDINFTILLNWYSIRSL
jgi:hypothetical protein